MLFCMQAVVQKKFTFEIFLKIIHTANDKQNYQKRMWLLLHVVLVLTVSSLLTRFPHQNIYFEFSFLNPIIIRNSLNLDLVNLFLN